MHNRRHFLLQGSLATAALLMSKSSKATDTLQSWFPQLNANKKYLTIVHGSFLPDYAINPLIAENNDRHVLLIDARHDDAKENGLHRQEDTVTGIHYAVVKKGDRNIGLVYAPAALTKIAIKNLDTVAGKLKQQHQCQLVICAWQVAAYSSTAKRPEREIAEETQNIDVFTGTIAPYAKHYPVIAINQLKQEVVFQYHSGTGSFNTMNIGFDTKGQRNHIAFG